MAPGWLGPGDLSPDRARARGPALFAGLAVAETDFVQLGNSGKCAYLAANPAAVRLSVHDEFRVRAKRGDQRLGQRQELQRFDLQRVRDRDRKRLCAQVVHKSCFVSHLFRCAARNAILQVGMFSRRFFVDGIRAGRGKNSFSSCEVNRGRDQYGLFPLVPTRNLGSWTSRRSFSLLFGALPCAPVLAESSRRTRRPLVRRRDPYGRYSSARLCSVLPQESVLASRSPRSSEAFRPPAGHRNRPSVFRLTSHRCGMSRQVAAGEIVCAHGAFRWGFIRGVMTGFIRGIRLEDHPLRPAEMLVIHAAGGSAGIPDSPARKPVDTSGRAGRSMSPLLLRDDPLPASHFHYYPPSLFFYFIYCTLMSLPAPRITISVSGSRRVPDIADLQKSVKGFRGYDRTDGFLLRRNAGGNRVKSLENRRLFLLCATRGRVIIELPPGGPENKTEYHTRREPCPTHERGKL